MADLPGYGRLAQFSKLTDRMIDDGSKDAIALAAQVLAIQVGHYQRKFGVIPIDEAMDLLEADGVTDEQAGWIADGLENLAVVLSASKMRSRLRSFSDRERGITTLNCKSVLRISVFLVRKNSENNATMISELV